MIYQQDIRLTGLDSHILAPHFEALKSGIAILEDWQMARTLPMLNLPNDTADLGEIEEIGAFFRESFANILLVGTGGSSLGGQTLVALKENTFLPGKKGQPRQYFMDNVDPHTMDTLLASIDLAETGILVVSKSGGTAEIMAQTLVLIASYTEKLGKESIARHFVSVTEPVENPLRKLSRYYGIRTLEHDPLLGGRFCVLSRVGLIPAAIAGLNVRNLRKGAASVMQSVIDARNNPEKSLPCMGAAIQFSMIEQGKDISVIMPYCDRLAYFGMWFRQLWAESLGKDGKGSTPIRAMGTVDQHSQLQLYLDGQKDKFFTLIATDTAGKGKRIDGKLVEEEKLSYIREATIGDVMAAYEHGTVESLKKKHCPTRILRMGNLDEVALGALLQHFMLETILTAHLMHINAFDQPAVEDSKIFARAFLSARNKG